MAEIDTRDATSWILELIDKVTAPAAKASRAVAALTKKLVNMERATKVATQAHAKLADAWRKSTQYVTQKAYVALDKLNGQLVRLRSNERLAAAATRAAAFARDKANRVAGLATATKAAAPKYWSAAAARAAQAGAGMRAGAAALAGYTLGRVNQMRSMMGAYMPRVRTMGASAAAIGLTQFEKAKGWWAQRSPGVRDAGAKAMGWVSDKWQSARGHAGKAAGKTGGYFKNLWGQLQKGSFHKIEGAALGLGGLYTMFSGGFFSKMMDGLRGIADRFAGVLRLAKIASAAVTAAALTLTKKVVDYAIFNDSSKRTLANLAGSEEGGQEAFRKSITLARELGLDVHDTVHSFKELLAAQFKIGEAEQLIKLSADLKDVTGDAAAAQRALLAMTQIKAKGKLQGQELTQQLANAGLSTKLVYEAIGKRLNVSVEEAMAMVSKGKINADVGLASIGDAIMAKLHEHEAGEAARGYVEHTITGLMDRLRAAPGLLFTRIAEDAKEELEGIKPILRDVIGMFESAPVGDLSRIVTSVFSMVRSVIAVARGFFDGFMKGFPAIAKTFESINLQRFVEFGKSLGLIVARLVELFLKIGGYVKDMVMWIADNRWIIYLWLGAKALGAMWVFSRNLFMTLYMIHGLKWLWGVLGAIGGSGGGFLGTLKVAGKIIATIARFLYKLPVVGWLIKGTIEHILFFLGGTAATLTGILAIVAAIVWTFYHWEDIAETAEATWRGIGDAWTNLGKQFNKMIDAWVDDGAWSNAGRKAGTAFLKGLWEMIRGVMNLINPLYYAHKAGVNVGGRNIWDKDAQKFISIDEAEKRQTTGSLVGDIMGRHELERASRGPQIVPSGEEGRFENDALNRFNFRQREQQVNVEINLHGEAPDEERQSDYAAMVEQSVRQAISGTRAGMGGAPGRGRTR